MRPGTSRAQLKTTLALALGCVLASHALAQTAPVPATSAAPQPAAPAILSDPTGVEYFPAKPSAPAPVAQPAVPAILSDPTGVEHFPAKPGTAMPGNAKGPKRLPEAASAKAKAPTVPASPVAAPK